MTEKPPVQADGRVYVLRVWHEGEGSVRYWRASLREGSGADRRHFANVDACIEHLYRVLSGP